jgi:hypothetical protein
MSSSLNNKEELTRVLVKDGGDLLTYEEAARRLWYLPCSVSQSLRLSDFGLAYFMRVLNLKHYDIDAVGQLSSSTLIKLSRRMTAPFHLHQFQKSNRISLVLFSEQDAMMMYLVDCQLDRFLETK